MEKPIKIKLSLEVELTVQIEKAVHELSLLEVIVFKDDIVSAFYSELSKTWFLNTIQACIAPNKTGHGVKIESVQPKLLSSETIIKE